MALGPQFDESKWEEHILKYEDDDSGHFGPPKQGELPKPGTAIYHGVELPEWDMLPHNTGIHWTTRPRVAARFASVERRPIIAAEVEDPENQIIPRLSLRHKDPRDDELVKIVRDEEQEYHVRPGARLRVTNRDELHGLGVTVPEYIGIDHPKNHINYINLEQFRVKRPQ